MVVDNREGRRMRCSPINAQVAHEALERISSQVHSGLVPKEVRS
jgi:hypothetical protein